MPCPMVRPNSRSGRALQTVGHVNARTYARAEWSLRSGSVDGAPRNLTSGLGDVGLSTLGSLVEALPHGGPVRGD